MLPKTIAFPQDLVLQLSEFLSERKYSQIFVLMDTHTEAHCFSIIEKALPGNTQKLIIPFGEQQKNLHTCHQIWKGLTEAGLDRHSLVVILGGGVLGDMGGFCSATYKRGIEFLLLPTTLLSQVDASIGGKLGIDFEDYKNHIGVFQEPAGTFIYAPFLETLPEGELRSGFAEVIKHCLISDASMWEKIRISPLEGQNWSELVRHSVHFKYSVIQKDPREAGLRKILNFGHTVGHAVEGHFLQVGKPMYHGEAVAIGMVAESFIAQKKGLLSASETTQISSYLVQIFGKRSLPQDSASLVERMKQDKKNQGKRILMALPQGIGKAIWDVEVSEGEIVESLDFYGSLQT